MRASRHTPLIGVFAFLLLGAAVMPTGVSAQDAADRYGVWRIQQDAPPPTSNIMTYEPYQDGGMEVTVTITNARGEVNEWGYVTLFDGVFREVRGQEGSDTAVEFIDDRSTRITNRRNGRVTQVIVNTLSADGNRIENEYVRLDGDGKVTGVGHAVYHRIQ